MSRPLTAPPGVVVKVDGTPVDEIDIDPDILSGSQGQLITFDGDGSPVLLDPGNEGDYVGYSSGALAAIPLPGGLASEIGTYVPIMRNSARLTTAAASGTKYMFAGGTNADQITIAANGAATASVVPIDLLAADYAVSGKTTKLRVKANLYVAGAPAVTITVGLYPLPAGANLTINAATVVSGSTVAFASPSANTTPGANSGDFNLPADGLYVLGYTVSGTPGAAVILHAAVQRRNV